MKERFGKWVPGQREQFEQQQQKKDTIWDFPKLGDILR